MKVYNNLRGNKMCIFEKSEYYRKARANPRQISQPIGHDFLSNQRKERVVKNVGEYTQIITGDINLFQILSTSNRRSNYQLQDILKVTNVQRKNLYTGLFDIINMFESDFLQDISLSYFPQLTQKDRDIQLASLLSNINLDSIFYINDYSLSTYFFFIQGTHINQNQYLAQLFNKQFIQYKVVGFYSSSHIQIDSDNTRYIKQPTSYDIENIDFVRQYIHHINRIGMQQDPLYCGIHFFFGFNSFKVKGDHRILKEQLNYLNWLQFYITVITGVLADGQSAIIPLRGTFRHKTNQYIFMIKMMFGGKINFIKPLGSNIFQQTKYLYCQDYNKQAGDLIHQHLITNYQLLKDKQEEKLLLNPKPIYKEDFETIISKFNDTIINKGLKNYMKDFKNNSNVRYYPPKARLIERVEQVQINTQKLISKIVNLLPQSQTSQNLQLLTQTKKDKIIEKEAQIDIINSLTKSTFNIKKQIPVKKEQIILKNKKKQQGQEKSQVLQFLQKRALQKAQKKKTKKKQKDQ